jgi:hypothetical protein
LSQTANLRHAASVLSFASHDLVTESRHIDDKYSEEAGDL